MNIKTRGGGEVKRGEKRGKRGKKRGRREVSANKKNLHQPGLHGGSLHSWQTGWWRGVRLGGLCMRELERVGERGGRGGGEGE